MKRRPILPGMDPQDLRAAIPALAECTFLNTGASGPSPTRVLDAVDEATRRYKAGAVCEEGMYAAASDVRSSTRESVAGFVGASPTEIALTESTADGINLVANALEWDATDNVVRPDFEHPAGVLPWEHLADRYGVEVRVVETEGGRLDPAALAAAVDESTKLVCCSSLTWTHGTRVPVEAVVAVAHEAGALALIDAVQSVGHHPVDVEAWGADFVAASGHKWLLGPWGTGVLYVADDVRPQITPGRVGYVGVDMDEDSWSFHDDARCLELGTAPVGPVAGLAAAIECIEAVGFEAIEARIETLTDRLKDGLGDSLRSPRSYESGLVSFADEDPEATVERLEAAGVRIRAVGPETCRASVHAFNTRADVDRLLEHR